MATGALARGVAQAMGRGSQAITTGILPAIERGGPRNAPRTIRQVYGGPPAGMSYPLEAKPTTAASWTFTVGAPAGPLASLQLEILGPIPGTEGFITGLSGLNIPFPIINGEGLYTFQLGSFPAGSSVSLGFGANGMTGGTISGQWIQ